MTFLGIKYQKGLGKKSDMFRDRKIIFLMNFNDGNWPDILNYTNVTQRYQHQNSN